MNFVDEGMDAGVRIGQLPDSSLRAISVGRVRRIVVGTPEYLEKHGTPQTPEDLASHRLVASSAVSPTNHWAFHSTGRKWAVRVQPGIVANAGARHPP
ncbi:MAG: LysR substrate-binding domain-containing protein [Pseudomonadales bacterium]